jgi:23S rRNA pseudoU1915 N3-methylase RlmH
VKRLQKYCQKCWQRVVPTCFAELVKEREANAKTRELLERHKTERLADRKRLRALEKRADQSDKVAPVMAENAALSARVAELEAQAVKPALPAPDKLVLRPDAAKRPQVQRFAAWLRNMATETCSEIQRLQNRSSD